MALVCEGRATWYLHRRGLDEFMRVQFNPFDLYYGSSAGAQNISAYLCNQPGYGRKVIISHTTRRSFSTRYALSAAAALLTSIG